MDILSKKTGGEVLKEKKFKCLGFTGSTEGPARKKRWVGLLCNQEKPTKKTQGGCPQKREKKWEKRKGEGRGSKGRWGRKRIYRG